MGAIRNLNFNPVITTAEMTRLTAGLCPLRTGPDGEEIDGEVGGTAREVLVGVLRDGLKRESGGKGHI